MGESAGVKRRGPFGDGVGKGTSSFVELVRRKGRRSSPLGKERMGFEY